MIFFEIASKQTGGIIMPLRPLKYSAIAILAGVLLSSCIVVDLNGFQLETVKGSGNVVFEKRPVPDFNQIKLEGRGSVIIKRGEVQSLAVRTDDNILPHVTTIVEGKKLIISHDKINLKPTTLKIFITVDELKGLSVSGSGEIRGNDRFVSNNFHAKISGSGSMDLELETSQLETEISGSGSIYLSGFAEHHRARISGSGKIDALDMRARNAAVTITGSGDCLMTALDRLYAKISGSGNALYKGYPQVRKTITGSGKVRQIN